MGRIKTRKKNKGLFKVKHILLFSIVALTAIATIINNSTGNNVTIPRKNLLEETHIPRSHVSMGQMPINDIRLNKIKGAVARIDPIIEDNSVKVELPLPKILPTSTSSYVHVDGPIIISTLADIEYIRLPANINGKGQDWLFRNDDDYQGAKLHSLQFGKQAGEYIETLSGAVPNYRSIISGLSNIADSSNNLTITD